MNRSVIAVLGMLAVSAVACAGSSEPTRAVAKPGQIVTVLSSGKDGLHNPYGGANHTYDAIAVDGHGNLFVDDGRDGVVLKVPPKGTVRAIADCAPDLPEGLSPDDTRPNRCANQRVDIALELAADAKGTVYLVDNRHGLVRAITPTGEEERVAGNGHQGADGPISGHGPDVALLGPRAPAVDTGDNINFGNDSSIVRVGPDGELATVAGLGAQRSPDPLVASAMSFDGAGNLYVVDGSKTKILKIDPAGTVSTFAGTGTRGDFVDGTAAAQTQFPGIGDIAVDRPGNVYLALSNRVVRIGTDGIASTVAGNGQPGLSGDGGPANKAQLDGAAALAVDTGGNLYIADIHNNRIRMVGAPRR